MQSVVDTPPAAKPHDREHCILGAYGEQCALGVLARRDAIDFSGCPSRGILQKLANLSLGQNFERPVACGRHGSLAGSTNAYMLKESCQQVSRSAPSSDVGQGKDE